MYKRFKEWVADSWEEMQHSNTDWGLCISRGSYTVNPRLTVKNVNGALAIGDSLYNSAGDLIGNIITTSPCYGGMTFIDLDSIEAVPLFGDILTTTSGASLTFVYQAQYSMYELAPDLDDLNYYSFYQTTDTGTQQVVRYVPWAARESNVNIAYPNSYINSPYAYTLNAQHMVEFIPPVNNPLTMSFSYIKTPYSLVNWYDVPEVMPARFHDLISWLAVVKYADYDNNSTLWRSANRSLDLHYLKADQALGIQPTMAGWATTGVRNV